MSRVGRTVAIIIAGSVSWVIWTALQPTTDPPTIAAENLAYARFGSVCPRGMPRSDVCQVLFRDVEKAYLAQHGGYR